MRIIAGEFRGRTILPPQSDVTRPITDRVKQSLFDILSAHCPDARVYDCFAGTGSLGLECLSRGAAHVTFFEIDRPAVIRLKQNIQALLVGDRSKVISTDLFAHFAQTPLDLAGGADLIFLDPPYPFVRQRQADLQKLAGRLTSCLRDDGLVIFRHDANDALELPGLAQADVRTYGGMTLEFLKRTATANV